MLDDELTLREHAKYKKVWSGSIYGAWSPGVDSLPEAHEFFQWANPSGLLRPDVLTDFGCGDCQALNKFWNLGYDPCYGVDIVAVTPQVIQACLWNLPDALPRTTFGFCADVMEHIPTGKVRQALENINAKCDIAYFRISLVEDNSGVGLREKLHLTVAPVSWWKEMFELTFGRGRVGIIRKEQTYVIIGVRREQ